MKHVYTLCLLFGISFISQAQQIDLRLDAHNKRKISTTESITSNIESTNIGPTVFSGRVSDVAVNPNNPAEFYSAYASGGLWYTNNNGTTFTPIFDQEAVMTIGDIAVDWENDMIWLGTGEVNSSRSSYAGVGIYKSGDKGKSWVHKGLTESHHIGRIVLHPTNPEVAWVAALGHLYSTNEERGVYKTTDGGQTWAKTLYINDKTGAVDLIIDPDNPNILYAATWERIRHAWNFEESGVGSGIYKSTDGGENWIKLNNKDSGFPFNEGTGRIGLDIAKKDGVTYLYAILDNYNRRPKKEEKKKGLDKNSFTEMSKEQFLELTDDDLQGYLDNNNFPTKYSAKFVKTQIKMDNLKPIALKEYVENANSLLFDTPVIAAEVYVSTDEGSKWSKTHEYYLDGVYNSYGYYFGQIRVDPNDPMKIYIMGVPILRSDDGGKNWNNISGANVHSDHHALWINPNLKGHIINGNDGGINISYDYGENWIKCNSPSVGQFYYINVDNAEDYNVYGGTQDNGVWVGSNNYNQGVRWQMRGNYPYQSIMGGDGMQVQIDNRDNNTVYTGFQFGNYFKINKKLGTRSYITPKHELGDRPYRWNWQSPILLSSHNQDILYMGSNKLLRSMDQGSSFVEISEDLTNGGKKGDVAFGTFTTISESSSTFGLIYIGTDDGNIWRTKNGGSSWIQLDSKLPQDKWVSRIIASTHSESRVFVTLNGYRDDDFSSYVYMSDDYGDTWTDISSTLPSEPVNVIKEDPKDEDILYVGTDHGTYVSINRGTDFMILNAKMPRVPVHDLVIQERDSDLLIGTHGRSIYKVDIEPLQSIDKALKKGIYLYDAPSIKYRDSWGSKRRPYSKINEPTITVNLFSEVDGKGKLSILSDKEILQEIDLDIAKGLSEITYDMSINPNKVKKLEKIIKKASGSKEKVKINASDNGIYYLRSGSYTLQVELNGKKVTKQLEVK